MIDLHKERPDVDIPQILLKSTILAMILTLPSLGIFLGIYFGTGNLLIGAVVGFGIHFVTLAFVGRISTWLVRILS